MSDNLTRILEKIEQAGIAPIPATMQRGLEKESLRIDADGVLSQRPHPESLGAALTHRYITTDYSEALLEFVTPVTATVPALLDFLSGLHQFAYRNIGDEKLWVNSMPCILHGEDSIPIADYGNSNAGRMKSVYRTGLAYRYGKLMQTISGIHFNFSLNDAFWQPYRDFLGSTEPLRDFKSEQYLGLMRNFYRHDWVIPYLFGASPSVCRTFLEGRPHHLQQLGQTSYYLPHATSLRLSDLGYQSEAQATVHLSLNSLAEYTESLVRATTEPYPPYQKIGIKVDGAYRQLNSSLLQIENEYYASIRPKRITHSGERPSHALQARGVEYIELRSLDLDPFLPVGIDEDGIRFLELMMLASLLQPSAPMDWEEFVQLRNTRTRVAEYGRDPDLVITDGTGRACPLRNCGLDLIASLEPLAAYLDQSSQGYQQALTRQRAAFEDSQNTPSARVLAGVHEHNNVFFAFAMTQAERHENNFKNAPVKETENDLLYREAQESLRQAQQMEQDDTLDFETFLDHYFNQ